MEKNHPENYLGKSRILMKNFKSTRRAESIDMYFNKNLLIKLKKVVFNR